MSKSQKRKNVIDLRMLSLCAIMAAFSIVFGKLIPLINLGDFRISFENLPILLTGLYFGSVPGVFVAVVADLLGCLIVGYDINPILTCGAASIGLLSGLFRSRVQKAPLFSLLSALILSHTIGSVFIKTAGLSIVMKIPFFPLLLKRIVNYLIVGVAEGVVLWLLMKNRALTRLLTGNRRKDKDLQ